MEKITRSSDEGLPLPPPPLKLRKVDDCDNSEPTSGNHANGNGNLSSKLHPLLDIDLVLQNVLGYLPVSSYKTSSLVCKTWLTAVKKLVVKRMTFAFDEKLALKFIIEDEFDEEDAISYLKDEISSGNQMCLRMSMGKFDCVEAEVAGPTNAETKIITVRTALALTEKLTKLNSMITDLTLEFCVKDICTVWTIISAMNERLSHLNINTDCKCCLSTSHHGPNEEEEDIKEMFANENQSFPNLKILSGRYKEKVYAAAGLRPPNNVWKLFRKLLLCSPNLEGLHCKFFPCHHHEMFDVLVKNPNALQHLKSLSCVHLNQDELRVLLNRNWKLDGLSMSLYAGFRFPALSPFLSSQGDSLETLEIDFVSLPNVPEKFPCGMDLVKLRHLSLKKFFGCIHFVSHMSNLESLTLTDVNLSVALHDEAAKYHYKSQLKALRIFGGKGSTGRFLLPTVYSDIVLFFPQLQELRIEYLTDSTLKIILRGLHHLNELNIPNGVYSDAVIGNANGNCANGRKDPGEATCLADLKKLRKVVLQSPKITDESIRYGLLQCRELRSIYIDSPMISDAGLKLLSQSEDIQHLEFRNCYQLTEGGKSDAINLWGTGRTLVFDYK